MPSAYSTASSSKTILCAHQGLEYYWGIIILYITHMKPCNILHYSHGATYCERAGIGVLAYNLQVLCFFSQNRLFPSDRAHTHTQMAPRVSNGSFLSSITKVLLEFCPFHKCPMMFRAQPPNPKRTLKLPKSLTQVHLALLGLSPFI